MKLALIGTGMIVKEVLPVLQTCSSIDLKALVSTPRSLELAKQLAKQYAITRATSDYSSVLEDDTIDTVYIATPNHLHHRLAKEAICAGKHVICEKPFTMTLAELDDLVNLAKDHEVFLLEAITNQYLANFQVIKEQLKELGAIKLVTCQYSQYSSRYDAFKAGQIAPAFDPKQGGGALRDLNIYNIHLIVGLFGQPQSLNYLANTEKGVDTSGVLTMDYGDFKAVAIAAKDSNATIASTIQGEAGTLTILGATNSLPEVHLTKHQADSKQIGRLSQEHRMAAEFRAFAEIIKTHDKHRAKAALDHSRQVMAVLDEAARTN